MSSSVDQRSLLEMSTIAGNGIALAQGSQDPRQQLALERKNQHDLIMASLMVNNTAKDGDGDTSGAKSGLDVATATMAQLQRIQRRPSLFANSSDLATMMGTISNTSMMSPSPAPLASANASQDRRGSLGANTDSTLMSLLDSIGNSRRSSMIGGAGGSTSHGGQSFHSSLSLMQEQQLQQQQRLQQEEEQRRQYLNQFTEQKQQEQGTSRRDSGYGGAPTVLDSNSLIQFLLLQQQQEAQQQLLQESGLASQNQGLQHKDSSSDGASSGDTNFDWFS